MTTQFNLCVGALRDALLVALLGLLPCGCPADATGAGGGGTETGGSIEAEPVDPFDGEGDDPPGDPDPGLDYPPPTSLGNGLVHDTRLDLSAGHRKRQVSLAQLAGGVDWASFVNEHAEKVRVGFRPAQVEAAVSITPTASGLVMLNVLNRSVYVSDDDANYRTATKTYAFSDLAAEQALSQSGPSAWGAPRPTSIDTFVAGPNMFGVSIVWTYDNAPVDWELVVGHTQAGFAAKLALLGNKGYRPISVSSRTRNGVAEYAGIFVQDGVAAQDWRAMLGADAMTLAQDVPQAWADGFYPFTGSYREGSEQLPSFDMLWIRRSPGLHVQARYNLDEPLFEQEDRSWRQSGFHLESATTYMDGGVERMAALWVKYDPYLRWTESIAIDPNDPTYLAQWKPFHDQVIQTMTLEGMRKAGEFFRPSATLHIFQGQNLVLDRAYTYAPAIYPDTSIDATMALASVSKSITAAAVVREMNVRGFPLTGPFGFLAGINHPAMANGPSVLDVLRNLGGFLEKADSYNNHALIDQSLYGSYPITGEMMFDYAVLGGHIDTMDTDTYWTSSEYSISQQTGALLYSNLGYTMLGELLRSISGQSYAEYVQSQLLVPLGLADDIYPDPGHRNAQVGPNKTGMRSYLLNRKHRYITLGCEIDAHCTYLTCAEEDMNCTPWMCGPNNTCLGCDDNQPCQEGWACMAGECVNVTPPLSGSEPIPIPPSGDGSPYWAANAGPIEPSAPATATFGRYAGGVYLGGAPLPAGGWHADGRSLGVLVRILVQTPFFMPPGVAAQLWDPTWWNPNHSRGPGWSYGLGWWIRGNWVVMAGGTKGAMATAAHNRAYDLTVVHLTNVEGNSLGEFLGPLMNGNGLWDSSFVGTQWPCVDDLSTPADECTGVEAAY